RKVVVGSRVLKTARSVAGDHDRSHLTSAGIGIAAAAGIAVGALIKGNYDGIVAFRPEPRAGDLLNHRAHKVVAEGDQLLILWVAWSAAIDAIGGRTVHVIALIRDDISEIGNVPLGQVVVELLDRPHLGKLSVAGLNTHEIRNTVVLRGVEGIKIGHAVAFDGVTNAPVSRIWHRLQVALPRQAGRFQLAHQAGFV